MHVSLMICGHEWTIRAFPRDGGDIQRLAPVGGIRGQDPVKNIEWIKATIIIFVDQMHRPQRIGVSAQVIGVIDKVKENAGIGPDAGGGVHGHPDGTIAGARAMRQAVDASMKRVPLRSYAAKHDELRAALKKWD